jgi:NAD(P)-dependent dehydrogenase (short-subunit alcohol dehydrogenase family)
MGRSIAKAALAHGDKATVVGRTFENSLSAMQNWHPTNSLGLLCDVRVRDTVETVIDTSISHWGRIDIIANCSGYGVIGAWEDQDEHEIRNQFETNFMGTLNMIQLSLPYFREREHGRYLIFSSTSGALGVPGSAPYCATKYAVEGLIESMLYEVDCYNIKATLVEPGYLRRDDTHPTMVNGQRLPAFGHFRVKPPSQLYANSQTTLNDRVSLGPVPDPRSGSSTPGRENKVYLLKKSFFPVGFRRSLVIT